MKRMNFPKRKEKRKLEAEARNAKTPPERRKAFRRNKSFEDAKAEARERLTDLYNPADYPPVEALSQRIMFNKKKGGKRNGEKR